MAKEYSYICQNCGAAHPKWVGKCSDCNAWNSIEMQQSSNSDYTPLKTKGTKLEFANLSDATKAQTRLLSETEELDRVLGGGFVSGSSILIGGEPGIGKSTLLLQLVTKLISNNRECVYITGEESIEQIKIHATRLSVETAPLKILSSTNVNDVIATLEGTKGKVDLIIIDSIQTMFIPDMPSAPGTVSQVRSSAHELITYTKKKGIILVLVGHVTKDGQIAGPKVLEHMVDTVLYFEGERGNNFRILRAVKNRFGNLNEIGVFEMSERGLTEINNPSSLFLANRKANISGSTIFPSIEGTRPVLIEVQALVSQTNMSAPRRAVVGWDLNRLSMMIAVLATRYGMNLNNYEVYLNVVGGLKVLEPAADLAVVCSLISAMYNKPISEDTVVFGEVGLSGEVRRVGNIYSRLKEAAKLGFKKAIIPEGSKLTKKIPELEILEISHVKQIKSFFAKESNLD